jgi:hypothetical protein
MGKVEELGEKRNKETFGMAQCKTYFITQGNSKVPPGFPTSAVQ